MGGMGMDGSYERGWDMGGIEAKKNPGGDAVRIIIYILESGFYQRDLAAPSSCSRRMLIISNSSSSSSC